MSILVIIFLIVVYFPLHVIFSMIDVQNGGLRRPARRQVRRRRRW